MLIALLASSRHALSTGYVGSKTNFPTVGPAGDLGSWLVRTGKATAADADRLSGKLRREWAAERIVATAPDPEPGNAGARTRGPPA